MAEMTTSPKAERGLLARLARRTDSEHEQAAIRVAIGVLLLLYYWIATLHGGNLFRAPNFAVLGSLFMLTVAVFLHVLASPRKTPWRRIAGIVLDACAITYFFFASDETAVPMYALYLWIIFGNGFRYGRGYLYLALVALVPPYCCSRTGKRTSRWAGVCGAACWWCRCMWPIW